MQKFALPTPANSGFSLVELSIVLVILGLLTGGILAGKSLIRASELRSISGDLTRYRAAALTFRTKYFELPGDMTIATRFWGDDAVNCADAAVPDGNPGTCNGNGDNSIDIASAANATGEMFQAWKQMSLAGLIEGSYTGLAGSGGASHAVIGTNSPAGKMPSSGFSIHSTTPTSGNASNFASLYGGSRFTFGASSAGAATAGAILTPEEAWNVDTKLDDGRPGIGSIIATYWDTCTLAATKSDVTADYDFSITSKEFALRFHYVF
jgi:prepilin-type N-terminal cleavage/methylation domain-containing protein